MLKNITFSKSHNADFYKTLQQRVREYFKENNTSRHANTNMVLKTVFMVTLYIAPFVLMLTVFENPWLIFLMWVVMGFGVAGVGLSVMHDANHGAYSKNQGVNRALGYLLNTLGGSDVNWRIQHNILHHTYTNVTGMDEDINPGRVMRFSPHEERLKVHRYQHVYAWFFYGLMTLMWCTVKDYRQAIRYNRMDLMKTQNISFRRLMVEIALTKLLYFGVFLVLPLLFTPLPAWLTVIQVDIRTQARYTDHIHLGR